MRYLPFFIPLFLLLCCRNQNEIPKELQISFDFIQQNWTREQIDSFKNTAEEDAVIDQHFRMGRFLRNNLLRHHDNSKRIKGFFAELGIFHLDDISSIILTSYHRTLNGKDIQLESQVDQVHKYWKAIQDCDMKMDEIAKETYKKFEIGDTIVIEMPVRESINSAVDYEECYLDWEFNDTIDLKIKGIVTKKNYSLKADKLSLTVQILSKSKEETEIFMRKYDSGDILIVKLKTSWKIN